MKSKKIVILDNIRSLYNVGAIFRTCDAAGVDKLYLCGITGHPNQSIRIKKQIEKTALGNINNVNWQYYKHLKTLINRLKKDKFNIVGIEQTADSIPYTQFKIHQNTAFIFGNETNGVSKKALELSDKILELPMKGKAKSLNVATSVGIVLYHFIK